MALASAGGTERGQSLRGIYSKDKGSHCPLPQEFDLQLILGEAGVGLR